MHTVNLELFFHLNGNENLLYGIVEPLFNFLPHSLSCTILYILALPVIAFSFCPYFKDVSERTHTQKSFLLSILT